MTRIHISFTFAYHRVELSEDSRTSYIFVELVYVGELEIWKYPTCIPPCDEAFMAAIYFVSAYSHFLSDRSDR